MRFKDNQNKLMLIKSQNSAYLWGRYSSGRGKKETLWVIRRFSVLIWVMADM